jgi:hypothetical protein
VDTEDWVLTLSGQPFTDPSTETPSAGTIEDWYYITTDM